MESIANEISKLNLPSNNLKSISKNDEAQIEKIITPLINNGEQLFSEIITQLKETKEWKELTENEKADILNMSSEQKAQLSLFFMSYSSENKSQTLKATELRKSKAVSCLASALGITAINDIVSGIGALMTAEKGLQVLKIMGKRYLGYIGLAIAVYEFVDCVS